VLVGDGQPHTRPPQLGFSLGHVQTATAASLLQSVLSTLAGGFRTLDVYLFNAFGGVRQNQYPVIGNLKKAAEYGQGFLTASTLDSQLASRQETEQRRVAWQDTKLALRPRRDNHVNTGFRIDDSLAGNNFNC
jgi:hypothetical protein